MFGFLFLALALFLGMKKTDDFFFSFHVSWIYFISIALGALIFVMIQFAAKVGVTVVFRRVAENIAGLLLVLAPFGLVMYFGSHFLFHHWMSAEALQDEVIQAKSWYLNSSFFFSRAAVYLVIWCLAALIFMRKSAEQDRTGSPLITAKLQRYSYGFLCFMGLSISFAAFDWIMSLDPHWYSTIFGIYFFAGSFLAACSAITIATYALYLTPGFSNIIRVDHFHDLSKLMFGFGCFWAYAGFFQYMLIWYGNIPEETKWFALRQNEEWLPLTVFMIFGHFVLPFFYFLLVIGKLNLF